MSSPPSLEPFLCYRCNRTLLITPSPQYEFLCSICSDGLIAFNRHSVSPIGPCWFPIDFSIDLERQNDGSDSPQLPGPVQFLQIRITTMANVENIQLVFDNNRGEYDLEIPLNLTSYFDEFGSPPTWRIAMQNLQDIKITDELLASDSSDCQICREPFELNEDAKQMPCKHLYHPGCILQWLEQNNSCPVSRRALPVDDTDYQNRVAENPTRFLNLGAASGSSALSVTCERSDGTSDENHRISWQVWYRARASVTSNRGVENNAGYRVINSGTTSSSVITEGSSGTSDENPRTPGVFRSIQIRIPFSARGVQHAETSNTGGAGDNASNTGESN